MKKILVEIVCCSVDDCVAAEKGGADRIELCSAIPLGGLTPSLGLLQEAKARVSIPIMAMLRPRPAGMAYTEADYATMERDLAAFAAAGADGVVFGALTPEGEVDVERVRRFVRLAGPMSTVFHRAFDVVPDPFVAMEQLIAAGVTRLLTSGQKPSVVDGVDLVRRLIDRAAGRIEVLPGAGIEAGNARMMVERTGTPQIHLAAIKAMVDTSTRHNPAIQYGAGEMPDDTAYGLVDEDAVRAVVAAVA